MALQVEAAAIDLLGVQNLKNLVRGYRSSKYGRMPITDLVAHYAQRKAAITEPSILIRINTVYRFGMTPVELYDATRSAWKVGERRTNVELAFAVYEGVIREVYKVTGWHEGGSTFNGRYEGKHHDRSPRWEFVGVLADDAIRKKYVNRYVGDLFKKGAQNPIAYVNVE